MIMLASRLYMTSVTLRWVTLTLPMLLPRVTVEKPPVTVEMVVATDPYIRRIRYDGSQVTIWNGETQPVKFTHEALSYSVENGTNCWSGNPVNVPSRSCRIAWCMNLTFTLFGEFTNCMSRNVYCQPHGYTVV